MLGPNPEKGGALGMMAANGDHHHGAILAMVHGRQEQPGRISEIGRPRRMYTGKKGSVVGVMPPRLAPRYNLDREKG